MDERISPEMGPNRLVFGGLARPLDYGGKILSDAEASELDPPATAEEELKFQSNLEKIREAERLTIEELNQRLG